MLAVPLAGLAGVLGLLAAGVAPTRLCPAAAFLAIAATASIVYLTAVRLSARRARRLRAGQVPWGVRLSKPLWLSAPEMSVPVELGGMVAALLALAGCPGIGAGVMLTFLLLASVIPVMYLRMSARALTFEKQGLRVHMMSGSFLIPWANIIEVEPVGPDHMQWVTLRLSDKEAIVAAATPATPRVRARAAELLRDDTPGGLFVLWHWVAGLDGRTLARALEAGRRGSGGAVN